jgi:hypothetical protein
MQFDMVLTNLDAKGEASGMSKEKESHVPRQFNSSTVSIGAGGGLDGGFDGVRHHVGGSDRRLFQQWLIRGRGVGGSATGVYA